MIPSGSALGPLLDKAPRRWGLLRFNSFWVPDVEDVLTQCAGNRLPTVRDFNYRERQARGKAYKYIARNRSTVRQAKGPSRNNLSISGAHASRPAALFGG